MEIDPPLADALIEACAALGLHFAEFSLRKGDDGAWMVVDLYPHLTAAALDDAAVLEAACLLLEGSSRR